SIRTMPGAIEAAPDGASNAATRGLTGNGGSGCERSSHYTHPARWRPGRRAVRRAAQARLDTVGGVHARLPGGQRRADSGGACLARHRRHHHPGRGCGMSQISGALTLELDLDRLADLVAARVVAALRQRGDDTYEREP